MDQKEHEVSIRERLKHPPAQPLVTSYYAPAVAAGIEYQFEGEMLIHLAHVLMLDRQKIIKREDAARILQALLELRQLGPTVLSIDYEQQRFAHDIMAPRVAWALADAA
jgi:argininosuccinate lyase